MDKEEIRKAITGNKTNYMKKRIRGAYLFSNPPNIQIRRIGILFLIISLSYPVMSLLPSEVKQTLFAGTIGSGKMKIAFIATVTLVFGLLGTTLLSVSVIKRRFKGTLTDYEANRILALEETGNLIGLGTASAGTLMYYIFICIGFLGVDAIESYGKNPYAYSQYSTSILDISVTAFIIGILVVALSIYIEYVIIIYNLDYPEERTWINKVKSNIQLIL